MAAQTVLIVMFDDKRILRASIIESACRVSYHNGYSFRGGKHAILVNKRYRGTIVKHVTATIARKLFPERFIPGTNRLGASNRSQFLFD